jgi:BASS family bile acid:Na+ symporter
MSVTELLITGANASVVVFVVSSTVSVGLGLTVPQILAPLRNGRLVVLLLLVLASGGCSADLARARAGSSR